MNLVIHMTSNNNRNILQWKKQGEELEGIVKFKLYLHYARIISHRNRGLSNQITHNDTVEKFKQKLDK